MKVILVPVADRPECARALDTAFELGKSVEGADALGALLGVDDVDVVTGADGLVWALGLACAAVDALFNDLHRHRNILLMNPTAQTLRVITLLTAG